MISCSARMTPVTSLRSARASAQTWAALPKSKATRMSGVASMQKSRGALSWCTMPYARVRSATTYVYKKNPVVSTSWGRKQMNLSVVMSALPTYLQELFEVLQLEARRRVHVKVVEAGSGDDCQRDADDAGAAGRGGGGAGRGRGGG